MRSHALSMGIDCWWSSSASFQGMHRGSNAQVLVLYVYGPTIEKLILLYGYWNILGKLEHNRGCWYSAPLRRHVIPRHDIYDVW